MRYTTWRLAVVLCEFTHEAPLLFWHPAADFASISYYLYTPPSCFMLDELAHISRERAAMMQENNDLAASRRRLLDTIRRLC